MSGIVVVGVDGSETAMRAAETAKELATALGATLRVVTAFDKKRTEVVESGGDKWILSDADEAEKIALDVATKLADGKLGISYTAAFGKPGEALIQEAERIGADLIVVGNRRMQGLGRVLGSVANTVAHNAPCDVYIAKTDEP
ncbi:universal stress protein [Arthrobacter sp. NyZ413]|uniref:universal stress protein n=1 Tax=Arthrobacter sp. NyZ413 TaxID=3144669 RepID=UPI002CF1919A|nr:universal stress protein [Arthrobacter sp.]